MNETGYNGPTCAMVPAKQKGRVEESLKNLFDCVNELEKLTESIVDNLSYSSDVSKCGESNKNPDQEPTLYERINFINSRISNANQRLILARDIIFQNLGDIKLD